MERQYQDKIDLAAGEHVRQISERDEEIARLKVYSLPFRRCIICLLQNLVKQQESALYRMQKQQDKMANAWAQKQQQLAHDPRAFNTIALIFLSKQPCIY